MVRATHRVSPYESRIEWYENLLKKSLFVIPAEAGNQVFQGFLDPGLRRGDGFASSPPLAKAGWGDLSAYSRAYFRQKYWQRV
jgi:hypothetical protein